jgi:uncharacterized YigZ family protein
MDIIDTYRTLSKISEGYYKDKGSKFIAIAYPVETEENIKSYVSDIKKKYFDARHHCYAYRLGWGKNEKWRTNDDGEPSGSAAKPIYGQILSNELTNTLIIVVRYFGGTKLGIPGLINAYKTATKEAIGNNEIVEKTIFDLISFEYSYEIMNHIMKIIKDDNLEITQQEYIDNNIISTIKCRKSKTLLTIKKIETIYGTKIVEVK